MNANKILAELGTRSEEVWALIEGKFGPIPKETKDQFFSGYTEILDKSDKYKYLIIEDCIPIKVTKI